MKTHISVQTIAINVESLNDAHFFVVRLQCVCSTDNGHPERAFFQKFETFGLGQTNWAEILGGILAISSQTIGTILAL